ncbi:M48 family metallopeptidase [Pyrococcus sp. ST04]|uniref:M48 family metallopeptidase n=1 Tax=Pyrococcus sp. ST04 TaxID=1183377 RepID=UPI0002605D12|nr:M48 family metallopeptidase [Pyrococcus sp. ST04]AFK23047.1 putative Heat shock protein/ Zn-dependent protease with chaperone function M48 family [Pyrococcus sp. ST04]
MLYWSFIFQLLIVSLTYGRYGIIASMLAVLLLMLWYKISLKFNLPTDRYSLIKWEDIPWLYDGIARMANRARISMPKIYIEDSPIPTAYSFRNAIVLSAGLFEVLDKDEILAVAAHEIGHIKNGDTFIFPLSKYAQYIMGALTIAILAGSTSQGIKIISALNFLIYYAGLRKFLRKREFLADSVALRIAEVPYALKEALEELKYYEAALKAKDIPLPTIKPQVERKEEPQNPIMYIMSTHPSYDERIARIMAIVDMYRIFEYMS